MSEKEREQVEVTTFYACSHDHKLGILKCSFVRVTSRDERFALCKLISLLLSIDRKRKNGVSVCLSRDLSENRVKPLICDSNSCRNSH